MRILSITTVRNEGPYLLEWIAHHLGAGITDFLIFSNDCDDGSDLLLDALDDAGIVTHIRHQKDGHKSIQWQALRQAWKHPLRKQADWVLVSDVDEFINIRTKGRVISDLLTRIPAETDAIVIPWRLFGHNDVTGFVDAPVTEQFIRAIPKETQFPVAATFFKTLFRTKGPFNQLGVHRPKQKAQSPLPVMVDGSGIILPKSFAASPSRLSLYGYSQGRNLVDMNHYSIRSAASFLVKKDRGLPNRSTKKIDLSYWVERNFNTKQDKSIAKMRPQTDPHIKRLHAIKGVKKLHNATVIWHQTRFDTLISLPDNHRILTQILTAGGSSVLPDPLQHQLVRWYRQAHS